MRKRSVLLAMVLFLVIFLAMGRSSYAQATKPIELKLSHWMSPMHNLHVDVFTPFAKELEERTKGRVKVTIFPGEALGKARDHYDLVSQGVVDIAYFIQGYTAGRFPLTTVLELPIGIPSGKVGSRVLWELYDKYLKPEYPGVKILTFFTHGPGHIHMSKKPIKTLEDIKGLRIRSPGPTQTALLRELGGSPLTIPMPDVYDALHKGMAEGAMAPFSPLLDLKLYEVTKFHTIANLYVMPMGLAMNPKVWAAIPPDIQKIIEELCGARMSEIAGANYDKYDLLGMDAAKKAKSEIISLSPEERKKWSARTSALGDKWIADIEAKGLPGKKVFEEASSLVEKYSK
ncbi:MAG: TRAP transporter substrate-binding protein [Thermodesulfobacteriota bacterium]|nr:TRAP transporter substrate-binding protein [Thermodesulfobacteriota bacterium]